MRFHVRYGTVQIQTELTEILTSRARARAWAMSVGKLQVATWRKDDKMPMSGNFLLFLELQGGDLDRARALPCSMPCSKSEA